MRATITEQGVQVVDELAEAVKDSNGADTNTPQRREWNCPDKLQAEAHLSTWAALPAGDKSAIRDAAADARRRRAQDERNR